MLYDSGSSNSVSKKRKAGFVEYTIKKTAARMEIERIEEVAMVIFFAVRTTVGFIWRACAPSSSPLDLPHCCHLGRATRGGQGK